MTRKSRIFKAENQPFIVQRICIYLGYSDMIWNGYQLFKWTQWNAWIHCPFSFIWYFMQTCNSTRLRAQNQFRDKFLTQICTGSWAFKKTYTCSVIFEIFHFLENKERMVFWWHIFSIPFVPFPIDAIGSNIRPKHMWVYCHMLKK